MPRSRVHSFLKEDFTAEENSCNQNLFEDQQQQLEMEVERLSNLTQFCSEKLALDPEERVRVRMRVCFAWMVGCVCLIFSSSICMSCI